MLLDPAGRFLYRHGVNLDRALRAFSCDYPYIVRIGVGLVAAWLAYLLMTNAGLLRYLGETR